MLTVALEAHEKLGRWQVTIDFKVDLFGSVNVRKLDEKGSYYHREVDKRAAQTVQET